jgi:hypothetical protein
VLIKVMPIHNDSALYVFADFATFRYLIERPGCDSILVDQQLEGYQAYIVEQWACSRQHISSIAVVYTGLPSDKVCRWR